MMSELLTGLFVVLWAISAVCIWVLKASVSVVVWLLTAPLRFLRGYRRAKRQQDQRAG